MMATLSHRPSVLPFKANINSFLSPILLKGTFLEDRVLESNPGFSGREMMLQNLCGPGAGGVLVSVLGAGARDGSRGSWRW